MHRTRRWTLVALTALVANLSSLAASPGAPAGAADEPTNPWVPVPAALLHTGAVALGADVVVAYPTGSLVRRPVAGASATTLVTGQSLDGPLASSTTTLLWLAGGGKTIGAVDGSGGSRATFTAPPGAKLTALGIGGGRVWFLDGTGNRVGTATLDSGGFGPALWADVGAAVSRIAVASDGMATLTTQVGAIQRATAGATITLTPVTSITPASSGVVPVVVGPDGVASVSTKTGITGVAADGTRTSFAVQSLADLAAGPGVIAFRTARESGFLRLADGTTRFIPRRRSISTQGPPFVPSDVHDLLVTTGGQLCAGSVIELACISTTAKYVPRVDQTLMRAVVDGVPLLKVHVVVTGKPGASIPTGTVTATDVRWGTFSEVAARVDADAAQVSAPLVHGVADIELPDFPLPMQVLPMYYGRQLFTAYLGNASYSANSSLDWSGAGSKLSSNADWVESAYANLFDRPPDLAAWKYWVSALGHGKSRRWAATALSSSAEAERIRIRNAFADFVGRYPTASELAARRREIANGLSIANVRANLAGSNTAFARLDNSNSRFVRTAYSNFLGHEPSADRLEYWTLRLISHSITRPQLAWALQTSREGAGWSLLTSVARGVPLTRASREALADALYSSRTEEATIIEVMSNPAFQHYSWS